jgi:hypothetical protein
MYIKGRYKQMAESKYEKLIVRNSTRAQHGVSLQAWSNVENARTAPPYMFLENGKPIQGVSHMVEFMWIWKDNIMHNNPEKPPHKHPCEELFVFMGTNINDPNELGADVDIWLGEGKDEDKLTFNTSSLVYIPAGLAHMPIVCRNLKKAFALVIFAPNAGDMRKQEIDCPVRKI